MRQLRGFFRRFTASLSGGDHSKPERDSSGVVSFTESLSALQAASPASCSCERGAMLVFPELSSTEKSATALGMPMRSDMEFRQSLAHVSYTRLYAAANPAMASRLQSNAVESRVAELGELVPSSTRMAKRYQNFTAILAAVILVPVVGFALLLWQFNRPPFDLGKLQRLQIGMNQQQVREVLGTPRSDYGESWAYSRFMAWPAVKLRFDESRHLKDWDYDY